MPTSVTRCTSRHKTTSTHKTTRTYLSWSLKSLGTQRALILLMFKSSVSFLYTVVAEISKSSEIALTVKRLSVSSMSFTFLTYVSRTDGLRPHLLSSSTDTRPSINRPCHLNTRARLHFHLVLERLIKLNDCVGVFPSPTQNFISALVSTSSVVAMFP